jgi:16S rRNA G1207 methylase RsmC
MKDHQKIINEYDRRHTTFIQHEWGQNRFSLYNQIVTIWNDTLVGSKIVIISYKTLGIKSAVELLKSQGITCSIIGKGPKGLRLVECEKTSDKELPLSLSDRTIEFGFRGKTYQVDVGEAVFSRTGLDDGTRFLLEMFFDKELDLNKKQVGDLGAGWGAISLILASEFPNCTIYAYEKDAASFVAAKNNLKVCSNVIVEKLDMTECDSYALQAKKGDLDYILCNPPFHSTSKGKQLFFKSAYDLLKRNGQMFLVTGRSFAPTFTRVTREFFELIEEQEYESYKIMWCQK